LSRNAYLECLMGRHDRLTPQEVKLLMQMTRERPDGTVPYDDFGQTFVTLRMQG
jgi:hypothetical protein